MQLKWVKQETPDFVMGPYLFILEQGAFTVCVCI